jgi:hypothetical protein
MIHVLKCNAVLLSHSSLLYKHTLCNHNHEMYFVVTKTVPAQITNMLVTIQVIETLL